MMAKPLLLILVAFAVVGVDADECIADPSGACPAAEEISTLSDDVSLLQANMKSGGAQTQGQKKTIHKYEHAHKKGNQSSKTSASPELIAFFQNKDNGGFGLGASYSGSSGTCSSCDASDDDTDAADTEIWKVCPACDGTSNTAIESVATGECVACEATGGSGSSSNSISLSSTTQLYDIQFTGGKAKFVSTTTGQCLTCSSDGTVALDSTDAEGSTYKIYMRGVQWNSDWPDKSNVYYTVEIRNKGTKNYLWQDGAGKALANSYASGQEWMLFDSAFRDNSGRLAVVLEINGVWTKQFLTYSNGAISVQDEYEDSASWTERRSQMWEFYPVGKTKMWICLYNTVNCLVDDGSGISVTETSCSSPSDCGSLSDANKWKAKLMAWPAE